MSHSPQVEASAGAVRKLWEKHGMREPFRFLAFCLSLLPLPVIPQAAQVLDRHLSDKSLEAKLSEVWAKISDLNDAAARVSTLEEAIAEVATTVSANAELHNDVQALIRKMGTHQREFLAVAEEGSYQQILHSLIMAESAYFLTKSGSTSVIEDATVSADRTVLHTSAGSKSFVNNTTFQGVGGSVSMHGMATQGQVTVSGTSLGLTSGSSLIFGGSPNLVSAACPLCNRRIDVDRRDLIGYTTVQCPGCERVLPFRLGNS